MAGPQAKPLGIIQYVPSDCMHEPVWCEAEPDKRGDNSAKQHHVWLDLRTTSLSPGVHLQLEIFEPAVLRVCERNFWYKILGHIIKLRGCVRGQLQDERQDVKIRHLPAWAHPTTLESRKGQVCGL